MNFSFSGNITKGEVFKKVETCLCKKYRISSKDENRPWGGFFVIDEMQSDLFLQEFFSEINPKDILITNKLSPKILIVEPGKKLSWQYHFRREELWKVIGGEVGIVRSETDKENEIDFFAKGSIIKLKRGERHRLVGLDNWALIAEIWQHTDEKHPSNEEDIVRLQDDYGR